MGTFQGHKDEDDDEGDEEAKERGYDKLVESQLQDAPSTEPTQVAGMRWRRLPCKYTPDTGALGYKGKGKIRRQWRRLVG